MLADDTRSNKRGELGSRAALRVLVGKFEDGGALAGDGILPNLTDLDRCTVWRAVRVGVRHDRFLNRYFVSGHLLSSADRLSTGHDAKGGPLLTFLRFASCL